MERGDRHPGFFTPLLAGRVQRGLRLGYHQAPKPRHLTVGRLAEDRVELKNRQHVGQQRTNHHRRGARVRRLL